MPLNEAAAPFRRRSGLTKEQKRQQEAAIYGVTDSPMDLSQFTPEQLAQLKQALNADTPAKANEFDLNAPPKQPYSHQEYPRLMYHHETGRTQLAHSDADVEKAIEFGWSKDSQPPTVAEESETSWDTNEQTSPEASTPLTPAQKRAAAKKAAAEAEQ